MSYSDLSGYGASYGSAQNNSNPRNANGASRLPNHASSYPDPASYQGDMPQSQHASRDCAWTNQGQQSYAVYNQYGYSDDAWRNNTSQLTTLDYSKQPRKHAALVATGMSRDAYQVSSDASRVPNTHALNSLAYASGLEPGGLEKDVNQVAHSNLPVSPTYNASSMAHMRVDSLVQGNPNRSPEPARTVRSPQFGDLIARSQSRLAEIVALEGKISRMRQTTSQVARPPSSGLTTGSSASNLGNEQARPSHQHTKSVPLLSQAPTQPPTHSNYQPTPERNHTTANDPKTATRQEHVSEPRTNVPRTTKSPALVPASINSSVSTSTKQHPDQPAYHAQPEQSSMPSYVDPSQVFNPYHREHERKKKEAAEAEARRKVAEQSRSAQPVTVKKMELTKPLTVEAVQISTKEKAPAPAPAPAPKSPTQMIQTSTEIEMANELKTMMEKMKEFRNKDPSLFQKLWDDMRKKGSAAESTSAVQIVSPPISQPPIADTLPLSKPAPRQRVSSSKWDAGKGPGFKHPANGFKVVIENNREGLPDLGRFPAERRVRGSSKLKDKEDTPGAQPSVNLDPNLSSLSQPPQLLMTNIPPPFNAPANSLPSDDVSTQALPAKTASGNSIWPKEKGKALAAATIDTILNSHPTNRGVDLTEGDILSILDQNPGYIDLCLALEKRGLKFHRGHLARQLLKNVPDLAGSKQSEQKSVETQTKSSNVSNAATQEPALPPAQPYVKLVSSLQANDIGQSQVATSHSSELPVITQPSTISTRKIDNTSRPGSQVPPPPSYGMLIPPNMILASGSKAAQARKRDFSELVDLTQLSDSEDYVMPRKKVNTEVINPRTQPHSAFQQTSQEPTTQNTTPSSQFEALLNSGLNLLPNNITNPQITHPLHRIVGYPLQQYPPPPPPITSQRPRVILARRMKKSEALRKPYYDPKTVARDILIAAGRHPFERPLNAHLNALLNVHIELDSDLTTFDWEAVDPGGPRLPKVAYVDVPAGPPRWNTGQPKALEYPPISIPPAEKQPESRNLVLTRQETPFTVPIVNKTAAATALELSRSLQQLSRTSELLRNSIQTSNQPLTQPLPKTKKSEVRDARSKDKSSAVSVEIIPLPWTGSTSTPQSKRARPSDEFEKMEGSDIGGRRRPGRPPGAKNKHPSITLMKQASKSLPADDVQALPPPKFVIYKCRWRSCGAELHNLPVLRQHVSKVHKSSPDTNTEHGFVCWWKKCQFLKFQSDGIVPTKLFDSDKDWMNHIEEAHLHPLGIKHGDGPSTTHIGKTESFEMSRFVYCPPSKPAARTISFIDPQTVADDRKRYLSDQQGRLTTASSTPDRNDDFEPDALTLTRVSKDPDDLYPLKSFMRAHGNEKLDVKKSAAETLRAMEVRKRQVGPGIDRGGCTLVNEQRRATLVQNAGISRVVSMHY